MNHEHAPYLKFCSRSRLDKSLNTLIGIIEGIAADKLLNSQELRYINEWLDEHREFAERHPFNELVPLLRASLADGKITNEEREDLLWLGGRLQRGDYFDFATQRLQELQAYMAGIEADRIINETELRDLSRWLYDNDDLRSLWPYDEVESLITAVMRDRRIDAGEHRLLLDFFSEFSKHLDDATITNPKILVGGKLQGLCAIDPTVDFKDKTFCFTGASSRMTRADLATIVVNRGGVFVNSVSPKVSYLVIGADGNPCWTYACYGRKVERAVELRKAGHRLILLHENDFHDATA